MKEHKTPCFEALRYHEEVSANDQLKWKKFVDECTPHDRDSCGSIFVDESWKDCNDGGKSPYLGAYLKWLKQVIP